MKECSFIGKTLDFSKSLDIDLVKKFVVFDEIPSTNIEAKELAENGEGEGTVVLARIQKKGRGRFNRLWESPDGGVYLSIILRPDCPSDKATLLSLLAAIAVSTSIASYGVSAKVKWPNDIRVNGKKIAGILLESEAFGNSLKYVILGIGINLNIDKNLLSAKVKSISTSLSEEIGTSINYHSFIKNLLFNLDEYYKLFLSKKYDRIIKEWKNQSDTLGRIVRITTSSEQIIGKVYDIDRSGFLIVILNSGKHKTITSGDCTYIEK
ncbi:MAG: biotin--[acetyl-CoA-carboxylase] ligase [Thermoplasmatales archaeon]|nr:MAG: biotin--[acetyl-CoA-carboxylase] ligase [Thermoplasmatales archaeon]